MLESLLTFGLSINSGGRRGGRGLVGPLVGNCPNAFSYPPQELEAGLYLYLLVLHFVLPCLAKTTSLNDKHQDPAYAHCNVERGSLKSETEKKF